MERAALKVQYKSNKTTMKKEAIGLAAAAAPKSVIPADYVFNTADIAASAAILAISASDAVDLQKKLVAKNLEIQKKLVVVAQHKTTVDTTYEHYVAHIVAFNAANKRNKISPSANVTPAGKGYIPPEKGKDVVSVDSNLSVKCSNPKCNTLYTVGNLYPGDSTKLITLDNVVSLSEGHHSVMCPHDHTTVNLITWEIVESKTYYSNQYYWNCPNTFQEICPLYTKHVKLCQGTCGQYQGYLVFAIFSQVFIL